MLTFPFRVVDQDCWVRRQRGLLLGLGLLLLAGCGQAPPIACTAPVQTQNLLMSEVPRLFDGEQTCVFQMPFHNAAHQTQILKVRAVGCSCFSVSHQGQKLKAGDTVEFAPGQTIELALKPPRPPVPKSDDYNFVVESLTALDAEPIVIDCRGTVRTVADLTLVPDLLTTSFGRDSAPQVIPFEIIRMARTEAETQVTPTITGWPANAEPGELTPRGAAELIDGLWSRRWSTAVKVSPPKDSFVTDQAAVLLLAAPDLPPSKARLMVRLNYGLSAPSLVHLSRVVQGRSATRPIQVISRDKQPFRILACEGGPQVTAKIDNSEAAATHWIALSAMPSEPGDWTQTVTIQTDHPDTKSLTIQLRAIVAAE